MCRGAALNESYQAVPESVPLARRALTAVAAAAGAGGERLEEIRLAVSEALTNAVLHAYRNGEIGLFHVTAAVASGGTEVQMRFDLKKAGVSSAVINHDGHALQRPPRPDLASRL